MIILFLLMMMICPSSAEPLVINNASTMAELLTAVDNTSIIEISDGYYTVYEPINITTAVFTLTDDTRIDTFAFIEFSDLIAHDHTLKGFESGRNKRTDSRYIESGYIVVRNDLSMINMYVCGLGSEYRAARYNNGITAYGNSSVTDTILEYTKRIAVISEEEDAIVYQNGNCYQTTQYAKTKNTFDNNTFKRSDVVVYNSVNVSLIECEFVNARISAHNYDNKKDPNGVNIESCTFTDTNDRQDGDGHYSGVHGYWANIFISDSSFVGCDIRAGDRLVIVNNCTLNNGDIVLSSARKSSVVNSTLVDGSILISGEAEETQIYDNNIRGDFYGIRVGTHTKYGTTSISKVDIHDNTIHNTTHGISIQNAHGAVHRAKFHDNHIYNSTVSVSAHGWKAHRNQRNIIYDNSLYGDVVIVGAAQSFYDNYVEGTLFIEDAPEDITMRSNTATQINTTNSLGITLDSCTIGMYNFFNDSNDNLIISNHLVNATTDTTITNLSVSTSTYTFNGSTHLSSSNMNFTVHSGALSEVSVSNLNGTYDLLLNGSIFVENVSTVDNVLGFTCGMLHGNYTIIEHTEQAEPTSTHPSDAHRSDSSAGARYWQSVRNANTNADIENKTNNAQPNKIHDEINNTHVKKYLVEKETTGMVKRETAKKETTTKRIINWIRNVFKLEKYHIHVMKTTTNLKSATVLNA